MIHRFVLALAAGAAWQLGAPSAARAAQFIVTDVTYTHSAETTTDSHYRVLPLPGTPPNWKAPVDYSKGSAHVLLEVKTKPGDTPTKFQICFEATPTYACTAQSPTYTKPGKYEWTTPFSGFWSPPNEAVDWTKGVAKVALILKDTANNKPQGDPKYVPTDLHVEVAVLSEGATYVAPPVRPAPGADAGAGGSEHADASSVSSGGSGGVNGQGGSVTTSEPDASAPGSGGASAVTGGAGGMGEASHASGGVVATPPVIGVPDASTSSGDDAADDSGCDCSVARSANDAHNATAIALLAVACCAFALRRSKR